MVRVLVVEDGYEYVQTLSRFLAGEIELVRAGCGAEALELLAEGGLHAVFLDMRFDRVPPDRLLGDPVRAAARFGGDEERGRAHLERHQGLYVLDAVRRAGHRQPVVLSHDFGAEPRRWRRLEERYAPVSWVPDNARPAAIRELLLRGRG